MPRSLATPQNGDIGLFKCLVLLTLPVLRFQQAIFPKLRSAFEGDKETTIGAVEHFIAFELHALMMLLDPTGALRSRLDEDTLKDKLKPVLDDLANGVISLVKAQEQVVSLLIALLDGVRGGEQGNGNSQRVDS